MADYFTQAVVQPSIPNACITPLERWLLERMFESEAADDDRTYFFASENINDGADLGGSQLEAILRQDTSPLATALREKLRDAADADWLDLSDLGHAIVFQEIIARHPERVPYVTIEMAFTCSRMRPDEFGGGAELITASNVSWINTSRWLSQQIELEAVDTAAEADVRS